MNYKKNSLGIYEKGDMKRWKQQREGIAERLDNFGKNIHTLAEAVKILEEAKKNNPKGLIF